MRSWLDALKRERESCPGPPFGEQDVIQIVLPSWLQDLPDAEVRILGGLEALLREHAEALRAELGAPFQFTDRDPGQGPRWFIGPAACNPALQRMDRSLRDDPVLEVDRRAKILISDAPTVPGVFESFALLKNMHWDDSSILTNRDCDSTKEAVSRIVREVACTWPSFHRRNLDWGQLCEYYAPRALEAPDPVVVLERWLAELDDAHTSVRSTTQLMPPSFRARAVGAGLVLHEVAPESAAWAAGARAGHVLCDMDVTERWARVGASAHQKPFLVALRMTSAPVGAERPFRARTLRGDVVSWTESFEPTPERPSIAWRRLSTGTGYLRVKQWVADSVNEAAMDAAFEELRGAPGLIVDLRANGGGNVGTARAFRDRFVRERSLMGYRQFSDPWGELGRKEATFAEPAPIEKRWTGPVRFLTDPLTYSASEDALLGLSGLRHVQIIGLESGGGSGQARIVRLQSGWRLMVSSCLTFDRHGNCIEGVGIPLDRRVPLPVNETSWEEAVLSVADRDW